MSKKRKANTPEVSSTQTIAEASRIEQTRMNKLRKLLNMMLRFSNQFRQKAAHYYEARQYGPAKTFLMMAKKLDQTHANTQLLMTVPKIREILFGLTTTLGPMTDVDGFDMNEIQNRVEEIFSDEMISFDSVAGGSVTDADMRELAQNFAMSMNQNEMDAFRRMDEAISE